MVDEIYKMKNRILQQASNEMEERGPDRIDVNRLGEMVDMVKDLAQAEKDCWKAQYYRNMVADAMEKRYGYQQELSQGDSPARSRMGYHSASDEAEKLTQQFSRLSDHDKDVFKSMIGNM